MNGRTLGLLMLILIATSSLVSVVSADQWAIPKKKRYYSLNKKYYLEVTPKKLESQLKYFEDKVEGKNNAGAVKDLKDNRAKAAFYARRADGGYSKKSEFPLVNEVSPVSALVANNGGYVVTFDNWHSAGYGDDVVVIYQSNGTLVKKLGLEDFLTKGDIETLPHSTSSIWWGGEHFIDESNGLLVLEIVLDRKNPWDEDAKFHEMKIELATGRSLEPKSELFPQPRVFGSVDTGTALKPADTSPSRPVCSSAEEGFDSDAIRIPPNQFYAAATAHPLPPYPTIAKAAHAESAVIVELLVSKTGDVICARSLSGHPLLRAAAVAAALNWKFVPFNVSDRPGKVIGTVGINFKLTEKDMNPNNVLRH